MEKLKACSVRLSSLLGFINSKIDNDSSKLELLIPTDESLIQPIELKSQMGRLEGNVNAVDEPLDYSKSTLDSVALNSSKQKTDPPLSSSESDIEEPLSLPLVLKVSRASVGDRHNSQSYLQPPQSVFSHSVYPILQSNASKKEARVDPLMALRSLTDGLRVEGGLKECSKERIRTAAERRGIVRRLLRRRCFGEEFKVPRMDLAVDSNGAGTGSMRLMPGTSHTQVYGMNNAAANYSSTQSLNPVVAAAAVTRYTLRNDVEDALPVDPYPPASRVLQNLDSASAAAAAAHPPKPTSFFGRDSATRCVFRPPSTNPTVANAAATRGSHELYVPNLYTSATDAAVAPLCSSLPKLQLQYNTYPVSPVKRLIKPHWCRDCSKLCYSKNALLVHRKRVHHGVVKSNLPRNVNYNFSRRVGRLCMMRRWRKHPQVYPTGDRAAPEKQLTKTTDEKS